jgi:NAD+ synthase
MNFSMTKPDKATLTERQKEVLTIYQQRHAANRHKIDPIPVCVIPPELRIAENVRQ